MKKNLSRKKSELVINEVFKDIIETLSRKSLKEGAAEQERFPFGDHNREMTNLKLINNPNPPTSPSPLAAPKGATRRRRQINTRQGDLFVSKVLDVEQARELLSEILLKRKEDLGFEEIRIDNSNKSGIIVFYKTSIDRARKYKKINEFLKNLKQESKDGNVESDNLSVVDSIGERKLSKDSLPVSDIKFREIFSYNGQTYSIRDILKIRYKFQVRTNEGIAFESIFAYVLSPFEAFGTSGNKMLDSSTKTNLFRLLAIDPNTTSDAEVLEAIMEKYDILYTKAEEAKKKLEFFLTKDNISAVINQGGTGDITDLVIHLKGPVDLGKFRDVTKIRLSDNPSKETNGELVSSLGTSLKWSASGKENKYTSNIDLGDGRSVPESFPIKLENGKSRNLIPSGDRPWWALFRIALCQGIIKSGIGDSDLRAACEREKTRLESADYDQASKTLYTAPGWMIDLFAKDGEPETIIEGRRKKETSSIITPEQIYRTAISEVYANIRDVLRKNLEATSREDKVKFVKRFHLGPKEIQEPILKISVGSEVIIKLIDVMEPDQYQELGVKEIQGSRANIDIVISGLTPARIQGVKFRSSPLTSKTKGDLNIKIRGAEI